MPRMTHRLTAKKVENLKKAGLHADGAGLYLKVTATGAKSWVYRFMLNGRPRYLGLGSAAAVKLKSARTAAEKARQLRENEIDPIEARKMARNETQLIDARAITFKACAEDYIGAHETSWRNAKHRQQWSNTLKACVYPSIGHLPVSDITTDHVLKILRPIWTKTPETASRVRGRVENILDAARARDARAGENPARWRGHLENLLPNSSKVTRVKHHAALPFAELPAFMAELRAREGVASIALEFTILTAARTNESLGAQWPEFDLDKKVWNVPAERMKADKEHRVPLSLRAIAILKELESVKQDAFIFPGLKPGRHLSNMSLLMLLRRMKRDQITVHGFRSTFRDWAAETTNFPNFVVEMALAHVIANKVEGAYRRGDLFDKRRKLMETWDAYCERRPSKVLAMRRRV